MLLMVTPRTQTLFEETRNAAHKVEDSIAAQNLFDEALSAVNELSVKSTRAGNNTNVQDVCKCAQEQIKIVSPKLLDYATKQLALPEAPANLSSQLSEPLKVFFLSIKGLDHAGPAELWCKR